MAWLSSEFYFYPGSAPCRAVMMTLKVLSVEYEDKPVDLLKAENKRPWFVRLNRLQTVPLYNDSGFFISESRAIMMYLCNKYCTPENQHLYPTEPDERGKVDRMLFFDMGTLSYAIKEYFKPKLFQGMHPDPEKENILKHSLDYLDGCLEEGGTDYICGDDITIADIAILAAATELDAMDYNYKCYGEFTRYINRLKQNVLSYKESCEEGVQMTKDRVKELEEDLKKQIDKDRKQSIKK